MTTKRVKKATVLLLALIMVFCMIPAAFAGTVTPQITSYTITPSHSGTVFVSSGTPGPSNPGSDDQVETLTVEFNQPIEILNAGNDNVINNDLNIQMNGGSQITTNNTTNLSASGTGYAQYATVAAGSDGKSLVFTIHMGFAMTMGHLTITSNGMHYVTASDGVTPAAWTNLSLYTPSGVGLETISQTVGSTATNTPASVTFQPVTPANAIRSMVHVLLLKNGVAVAPDSNGASLECHYHDYLDMDGTASGTATYAAMWSGYFSSNSVVKANYSWVINGSQITLTENSAVNGDVLDLLIWAYPQDRPTGAIITGLNAAIANAANYPTLAAAVTIANTVDKCVYYTQANVDNETQTLNNMVNFILSTPTFSLGAGTYSGAVNVTINNPDSVSGVVYYTIDGSDPTASGAASEYNKPVVVSVSETVYAAVYDTVSHLWSTGFKAQYIINPSGGGGGGGGSAMSYKPAVQTQAATSVASGSAVLNGDITSDSGYNITDYGFLWGANSSSLTNKLDVGTNNQSGSFIGTLSSLTAGTTYYFQAYATNSQGTADGNVMSFTAPASTTSTTPAMPAAPTFSDVPSTYWGYAAISSLSSQGIVSGYPDGAFKPNASISRAEFATMLIKALGLSTTGTTSSFTDVTADSWYYGAVSAAVHDGLVSGMSDRLFAPNALITREQMAVMVAKALGTKAPAVAGAELNTFSDSSAVSNWAVSGLAEAVKAGIVSGMTAGTLAPHANATRAQAAMMIYKMLSILGK